MEVRIAAFVTSNYGDNWLFISKIQLETLPPKLSLSVCSDVGAVAHCNAEPPARFQEERAEMSPHEYSFLISGEVSRC